MKKKSFITGACLILMLCHGPASAQAQTESKSNGQEYIGIVSDENGEPLIGASVVILGQTAGVNSDANGQFSIYATPGNYLNVSYIGFRTESVRLSENNKVSIVLKEDSQILESLVVIGYGVQKKKLVTGSTTQVKGDELTKMNTNSALGALQSQTPGVVITQNNAEPGGDFKVTIRGIGTTGNSAPLYIIDGVPVPEINVSPNDIESIDILKDAASSAIYGSRAANGVILITTKQGSAQKTRISYNGYIGFSNLANKVQQLDAKQYIDIVSEAMANNGETPTFETWVPRYDEIMAGAYKGTDWIEESTNKNAITHSHSISAIGGNKISNYSFGYTYDYGEGILGEPVVPKFSRHSIRFNSSHVLFRNSKDRAILTVGENFRYTLRSKNGLSYASWSENNIRLILLGLPILPIKDEDGNYTESFPGYDPMESYNPLAKIYYTNNYAKNLNNIINGNVYLKFEPIKNLVFRSSFGATLHFSEGRYMIPVYRLSANKFNDNTIVGQKTSSSRRWIWENTLSYDFKIKKDHKISILAGMSLEASGYGMSLSGENINPMPDGWDYAYLNNIPSVTLGSTKLNGIEGVYSAIESFFGRINYNYKERYMGMVSVRADGSSKFSKGHRWGVFPAVSLGWNIIQEDFAEPIRDVANMIKLRASWGQNGNQDIANFQYLSTVGGADSFDSKYTFGPDKLNYATGLYFNKLANPDITWETSEQFDVGLDMSFLKNRLQFVFDYYIKTTKDWLVTAPIQDTYGMAAPTINGGDVRNMGYEIALTWKDHIKDFDYAISVNGSANKNTVTRIDNSEGVIHGPKTLYAKAPEFTRTEVGYPIGYFWGYKSLGVFQNMEEIQNYKNSKGIIISPKAVPGDLKLKDINDDGIIDELDRTYLGDPNPKFTLGLNINLSYKWLDFSFSGYGAFGQKIARIYSEPSQPLRNYPTDILGRWHGEGTSNKLPRISTASLQSWIDFSDIYLENGDYFRGQNITLGFDFKKLFKNLPLTQLRIYGSVQNAFCITAYKGWDPEIGNSVGPSWVTGVDVGFYPRARTFILGLNITY